MSNSSNFNSNDRFENIIKALTEQLLTKEDLKGIDHKLIQITEAFLPNLPNPEVRGGMKSFGNPTPDARFFQPPANPGVNLFKNSNSFKINPFNGAFPNPQTNNGPSQTEAMKHPSDDIIRTPTGQIIVVKRPLIQPDEQYIRYELNLADPELRVTHHVLTPSGYITLYYTTIDGKIIGREVLSRMPQQQTMSNYDKSNPLSGAFPSHQFGYRPFHQSLQQPFNNPRPQGFMTGGMRSVPTPEQDRIDSLEKRVSELERLVNVLTREMENNGSKVEQNKTGEHSNNSFVFQCLGVPRFNPFPPVTITHELLKDHFNPLIEKLRSVEDVGFVSIAELVDLLVMSLYGGKKIEREAQEIMINLLKGRTLTSVLYEQHPKKLVDSVGMKILDHITMKKAHTS